MRVLASTIFVLSAALAVVACGPTPTGDDDDDDDDQQDAAIDTAAIDSADIDAPDLDAPDLPIDAAETDAQICPDHTCTTPVVDGCVANETCNNGTDDNCNGQVDEGCLCTPGAVQACFRGPRLFDSDETRAVVAHWVAWYQGHRAILESDLLLLRRADGRVATTRACSTPRCSITATRSSSRSTARSAK